MMQKLHISSREFSFVMTNIGWVKANFRVCPSAKVFFGCLALFSFLEGKECRGAMSEHAAPSFVYVAGK